MKMLNPNAAEWMPTAFSAAAMPVSSCAAASKNSSSATVAASKLSIQASTASMQVDSDAGVTTPNGLAELASVLSGAASADMTFEDLMFDNSSRRGSVSCLLL